MSTPEDDPDPRPLRRNDIVYMKDEQGFWAPYGRVWKRIGDRVAVILCTRDVHVRPPEAFQRVIYKGRWDTRFDAARGERVQTYFRRMATLRQLKRMAAYYHPEVWRKGRKRSIYDRCPLTGVLIPRIRKATGS